jgi:hypothetical protein
MRSGPATRTAFCQREFHVYPLTPQRAAESAPCASFRSIRRLTTLFEADPELRSACAPESAPRPIASAGCSLAMRDRFLRRPQRPGHPNAFTFGNRSAAHPSEFGQVKPCSSLRLLPLGKLPQNRLSQSLAAFRSRLQ